MINTPIFVDDMKSYTTYDQHSVDDADDYKPPYNVCQLHVLAILYTVHCVFTIDTHAVGLL